MKNSLAWVVSAGESDTDDECACVVFAPDDEGSIELGWRALGLEDREGCLTSRAPQFDQWAAQGYVPPLVLLSSGWFLTCHGCEEWLRLGDEHSEPVEHGRFIFCCQQCKVNMIADVMKVNSDFESFQEEVKARYPSLTFTEFEGGWPILTPFGRFTFPGSLFGGGRIRRTREGGLEVSVATGDMKAWELWSSQAGNAKAEG